MPLETLRIYNAALAIGQEINSCIKLWSSFDKQGLGIQMSKAVDSIAANISEGYGRSSTGEKLQFIFYADGSIQESKNHIRAARGRHIITDQDFIDWDKRLRSLSISLIEYGAAILKNNPDYKGQYRKRIEQRRIWLLKQQALRRSQPQTEHENGP